MEEHPPHSKETLEAHHSTDIAEEQGASDEDIDSIADEAENYLKDNEPFYDTHLMSPASTSFDKGADTEGFDNKGEKQDQTAEIYVSPRKLPVRIPQTITADWVNSLPLLSMSEDDEDEILDQLQKLAAKVESGEAFDEFMVSFSTDLSVMFFLPHIY